MENNNTDDADDDDRPLTPKELMQLEGFLRRGAVEMVVKGEFLVLEAFLEVPGLPDYATGEEVGKFSLRSIMAESVVLAEREDEILGEDAREKLLAMAGRMRELARLLEQREEKMYIEEWEPELAANPMPTEQEPGAEEEFPPVDLGAEDDDNPFDRLFPKSP